MNLEEIIKIKDDMEGRYNEYGCARVLLELEDWAYPSNFMEEEYDNIECYLEEAYDLYLDIDQLSENNVAEYLYYFIKYKKYKEYNMFRDYCMEEWL